MPTWPEMEQFLARRDMPFRLRDGVPETLPSAITQANPDTRAFSRVVEDRLGEVEFLLRTQGGALAGPAPAPKFEHEKCYGVAKAGKKKGKK